MSEAREPGSQCRCAAGSAKSGEQGRGAGSTGAGGDGKSPAGPGSMQHGGQQRAGQADQRRAAAAGQGQAQRGPGGCACPHLQRDVGAAYRARGAARELVHLDFRQSPLQRLCGPANRGWEAQGEPRKWRRWEQARLPLPCTHIRPPLAPACAGLPQGDSAAPVGLSGGYSLALLLGSNRLDQLARVQPARHRACGAAGGVG